MSGKTAYEKAVTITEVGTFLNTGNSCGFTTFNFTSSLGTADSSRIIVVAFQGSGCATRSLNSVTAAGVSLTQFGYPGVASGDSQYFLAYGVVPTGTSGTISITFSGSKDRGQGAVYAIYNAISATPYVSGSGASSTTVATKYNSGIIACCGAYQASTFAWTNITEQYQGVTGSHRFTVATQDALPAGSRTVSVSPSANILLLGFR